MVNYCFKDQSTYVLQIVIQYQQLLILLIILVHVKLDIKRCQLTLLNIVKSTANKIQHFILKTTHVHATTVMKT